MSSEYNQVDVSFIRLLLFMKLHSLCIGSRLEILTRALYADCAFRIINSENKVR